MSIQNQFSYYRNKTKKYGNLIKEAADAIVYNNKSRSTFYLEPEILDEKTIDLLGDLKRIIQELDNKKPFSEVDNIRLNEDINFIKSEIKKDIILEICEKGFKVCNKEGYIYFKRHI